MCRDGGEMSKLFEMMWKDGKKIARRFLDEDGNEGKGRKTWRGSGREGRYLYPGTERQ